MKNSDNLIAMGIVWVMLSIGCSKDDDPNTQPGCLSQSWSEQIKEETDAVEAAATSFSAEPSKTTCENFRTAYIDYIEALEKLEPCVLPANRNAFLRALDQGKVELQNLDCNQDFTN